MPSSESAKKIGSPRWPMAQIFDFEYLGEFET
jgi:hypothetical protein